MVMSDGFTRVEPGPQKRKLLISVQGFERTGKTRLGLTGPEPIFVHLFDRGVQGVIQDFANQGKEIHTRAYEWSRVEATAADADRIWEDFKEHYARSLESSGTVIIDTASELWEIHRIARFDRLTAIDPIRSTPVPGKERESADRRGYSLLNAEHKPLIKMAENSGATVVFTLKLKEEWKQSASGQREPSGEYKATGYGGLPYLVQMQCTTRREGADFYLDVLDSFHRPERFVGKPIPESMINLDFLFKLCFD